MLRLDHLAVSGQSRDAASLHVEKALGVTTIPGGQHVHFGTHNRLVGMGPEFYLEAIAIDPDAPKPDYPRWFNLDGFAGAPRLTNWIVATDDLAATLKVLGLAYGTPVPLARGDLRWTMAVPDTGLLPFDGFAPAIIEWHGKYHPAPNLQDSGARLMALTVSHPDAGDMADTIGAALMDDRVTFKVGPPKLTARIDVGGCVQILT